ncbi:MAG: hypothetical protein COV35_02290 [Alphaproteobacteria bacterium CG11_big_fil_rev_8_21_14_0_20_39_49]|nr:MAG: hypothetical protein COV35_02290 [Alphaproteobacteria bacterium CG11_big_fil_rev_8_21_14_0_20_39_49]
MRKHIGNITIRQSKMVEKDPKREEMRQNLVKEYRLEESKLKAIKELKSICNNENITEVFLNLFGKDGKPPKHITMRSMIEQYELLDARRWWFITFRKELMAKYKQLDPDGYNEILRREEEHERLRKEKMEQSSKDYIEKNDRVLKPIVQKGIRDTLLRRLNVQLKKRSLGLDMSSAEVLGSKKIEKTMCYLFTEYIRNPKYKLITDPVERCKKIKREIQWLDALIVEVEEGLIDLNELVESAYIYLQKISAVNHYPGEWRKIREENLLRMIVC